jgi:hypothetical protein
MGLRNETCDACFLRDKGSQSPFLMSTDNEMDPGEIPAYLPVLTQKNADVAAIRSRISSSSSIASEYIVSCLLASAAETV